MTDLLPTLGALSLGGSAAVLLFALTARASRARYGARWRCWVWMLLCLRLAVPFSLLSYLGESRQAPVQLPLPSDPVIYEYTPWQPAPGGHTPPGGGMESLLPPSASHSAGGQEGDTSSSAPEGEERSISLSQMLLVLWLAGVAAMAIWTVFSHLRFLRWLRRWSRPMRENGTIRLYNQMGDQLELDRRPNLRVCTGLRAPMLAGLVRPVLLLPEDAPAGEALRYSLLHELTHYKRRDIWLKALALLVNIIHWFNPFMWYMVRLVERDAELACDEAALRRLPPEDHAAYGLTILEAVERLRSR